jgi:hypothetical protein
VHLLDASAADFRRIVDVNRPGSFLCAQAAARIMITQQQCNPNPRQRPQFQFPLPKTKLPKATPSCHLFTGIWVKDVTCYAYSGYTNEQAAMMNNKAEYGRYALWQLIAAVSQHQLQVGDPLDPPASQRQIPWEW